MRGMGLDAPGRAARPEYRAGRPVHPAAVERLWLVALGASAVLVGYGNLSSLAVGQPTPWPLLPVVGHPLLVGVALLWARPQAGLTWAAVGLAPRGWGRSALLGLGLGGLLALAVGALVLLARAIQWGSTTAYPVPTDSWAFAGLLLRLLLATAVCEEVWFRGLLQACWVRLLGPGRGIAVGAVLFALWHLAIWAWTLERVVLTPPLPFALVYPAGLVALAVAGLLFGWLREASGHLAGPIVAHWAIDVWLVALVLSGWL
jgi:membrane protease YdiL (CAAX protease family)